MTEEQPPKAPDKEVAPPDPPQQSGNVVSIEGRLLRRRVVELMSAALEERPPVATVDATEQMSELDINKSQIIHGIKRADILEFSEDVVNGRVLFTARLMSAGEEFFVSVGIERLVPFSGTHVVIRRVWRLYTPEGT